MALIDPSGFSRPYDHELARALARHGNDVSLWTASFVHGDAPAADGYSVRELFYRRSNRLNAPSAVRRAAKAGEHLLGLRELRSRLRAERVDVVHVQWAVLRPVERRFYTPSAGARGCRWCSRRTIRSRMSGATAGGARWRRPRAPSSG